MNYITEIKKYKPVNEQEQTDKEVILDYINSFPDNVLLRDNKIAHMTSSGIIVNKEHTKMLMIHHNIYNTWTWIGGHADGEEDMLKLTLKEAREETGLEEFKALGGIKTIDVIPVPAHIKHGKFVSPHLHLNVAYVLEANEEHRLVVNEDETSGIKWVSMDKVPKYSGEDEIIYVYKKILKNAGIHNELTETWN